MAVVYIYDIMVSQHEIPKVLKGEEVQVQAKGIGTTKAYRIRPPNDQ